jgi:hypothetical protein
MQHASNGNGSGSGEAEQRHARAVSAELVRLQRGELSLDEYLETRVEEALDLVRGRVSAERLEMIREVVRDAMAHDPVVLECVRRLTLPSPRTRGEN